jgi:Tol biopolymer transport system component
MLRSNRGTPDVPLRASLLAPPGDCDFADIGTSNLIQLSPDGSSLAFVAICSGSRELWIRNLSDGSVRAIAGTSNALYPFWSPDGQSVGFFAEGRLKRIDLASGTVRDLAPALNGRGGAWSRDGIILYAPDVFGPLYRIPAAGGTPERVTVLPEGTDITQRLPYFLPDGHHFLFVEGHGQAWAGSLLVGDLASKETKQVLEVPSNVAFSGGRLFYVRDGALFAQSFSPDKAAFTGSAVAVVPRLETWPFKYIGNFSVADRLLVYRAPSGQERMMDWFDPATRAVTPAAEPGPYSSAHLSPDGAQVLLARASSESPLVDAWIYTPATQGWSRLTTHPDISYTMAWAPDGARIALKAASDSVTHVLSADHREVASYAVQGPGVGPIEDWSRDGSFALGTRQVRATGLDVTLIRFDSSAPKSEPLFATPADEEAARLSPSGRLVAYLSNQSGRMEVYLSSLADAAAHSAVSQDGAYSEEAGQAVLLDWSRDGHTLYFIDATQHLMAASISEGSPVSIGRPARVPGAPDGIVNLGTAPGGRLLILHDDKRNRVPLTVVTDWRTTLGGK